MSTKYKAVQVTKPGKLEIVEKAITESASGQVRIRLEACGVCHTDALTVEGAFPGINYPRVPGHEVVGTIEAIGPDVDGWKEGQRVGTNSDENEAIQNCPKQSAKWLWKLLKTPTGEGYAYN